MPRPETWCHPEIPYGAKGMCRNCYKRFKEGRRPDLYKARYRRSNLKSVLAKHDLTHEQYEKLLADQDGLCAVCRRGPKGKTRLSIDHCHRTGKVRGLLCDACNTALGMLDDDVTRIRMLSSYLTLGSGRLQQLYHYGTPFATLWHGRPVGEEQVV